MHTPSVDTLTSVSITILLTALLALGAFTARSDGWLWPLSESRKASYGPEVTHFFTFAEHAGVWALVVLNVFLAIAMANAYRQWNLVVFFFVFVIMQVVSLQMMLAWAAGDNEAGKRVLSAFSRNGFLIVTGVLLSISMAIAYTIIVMYFLTPGVADGRFAFYLAIAVTFYLPFGLLQPPLHVWGNIHEDAWKQWAGGTVGVWVLYLVHTYVLR